MGWAAWAGTTRSSPDVLDLESRLADLTAQVGTAQTGLRAQRDTVTELPGSGVFLDTVAREWQGARRRRTTLAVVEVAIDEFRRYNAEYSTEAGDACLRRSRRSHPRRILDLVKRRPDLPHNLRTFNS